jgi:2-amino-4-hydroxy-6-hydroxymethyldihydropteridine diphosphokinase
VNSSHFIGIGSNIGAKLHISRAIGALLTVTSELTLSRVLETQAKGIASKLAFLNAVVYLRTDLTGHDLKERLNDIEGLLGRDRSDPERGQKDRSIDLDVLLSLPLSGVEISVEQVSDESYYRPQMLELIHILGLPCPIPIDPEGDAVEIEFGGTRVGSQPVLIGGDGEVILARKSPCPR